MILLVYTDKLQPSGFIISINFTTKCTLLIHAEISMIIVIICNPSTTTRPYSL